MPTLSRKKKYIRKTQKRSTHRRQTQRRRQNRHTKQKGRGIENYSEYHLTNKQKKKLLKLKKHIAKLEGDNLDLEDCRDWRDGNWGKDGQYTVSPSGENNKSKLVVKSEDDKNKCKKILKGDFDIKNLYYTQCKNNKGSKHKRCHKLYDDWSHIIPFDSKVDEMLFKMGEKCFTRPMENKKCDGFSKQQEQRYKDNLKNSIYI